MIDNRKILQEIVGEDEGGSGRALSCLMIERRFEHSMEKPEVCGLVSLADVVLSVSITNDFVVVSMHFEDYADYDYLQTEELCRKYEALVDVGSPEGEAYSLVLSIVPKGEYDIFFVGLDAVWSYMPEKPEGGCKEIRLIFLKGKFGVYEFEKEAVEELVAEATEELLEDSD